MVVLLPSGDPTGHGYSLSYSLGLLSHWLSVLPSSLSHSLASLQNQRLTVISTKHHIEFLLMIYQIISPLLLLQLQPLNILLYFQFLSLKHSWVPLCQSSHQ